MSSLRLAGRIEGITSTESFTITFTAEGIGKNDYLEISHEGTTFLLMVKDVRRYGERSEGTCLVIGRHPKTPFLPGAEAYLATEETLRRGLGLETPESEGIYLGRLKGADLKVWLPIKKLTRIFVVGKPGAGKSYSMGVMAEELLKKGIPLVIIDAHGEYSSLKVPADAKEGAQLHPSSFSEQIIEFGDMTFNPGADIDLSALEGTRAEDLVCQMQCTIINLRGLAYEQQHAIVAKVLKRLLEAVMVMRIPPFYLALDEAHLFAGRSRVNEPNIRETLEVIQRFAQEGRKFGANMIVLTQRPQLLDMTVRSLSATWIIHRLTDPNDVRIAVESGGLEKDWEDDVNWLESGEAVVTGDVVERIPLLIKIRPRETRHGAPGFNPLDFVSPEEREKMRKRMVALKEKLLNIKASAGFPQPLPPTLPSLYLPIRKDERSILAILKEKRSLDGVELLRSELRYLPALFAEVTVNSERKDPDLIFSERIKRLVPADASTASIDWRHEAAFRMVAGEVLELPLSPAPVREGRHETPSSMLLDPSGVEGLRGALRNYATSKLTQPVYHHKGLEEYSKPGESIEDFRSRLRKKLDDRKRAAVAEVRSRYAKAIGTAKETVKDAKEEYEGKERLLSSIKSELRSLEKDFQRAKNEGRSTLKLSSQIQLREERIARLENRIKELSQIMGEAKREEGRLESEMVRESSRMENSMEKLMETPLESMVFQPRDDEVETQALQLLWIPSIEALFRGVLGKSSADFSLEWNAVNGRGVYGNCSECGTSITSLDGDLFCFLCAKIYCDEHLHSCAICHRAACSEHIWKCQECGKISCKEEKPLECAACGRRMCKDCARRCIECAERVYCSRHINECAVCKKRFCPEHNGNHIKYCERCGKGLCTLEQLTCKSCGKIFCKDDAARCSVCGRDACTQHSWRCSGCGKVFCEEEVWLACKECGTKICPQCSVACKICGSPICRSDTIICPNCSGSVCKDCMVETKRLGVFKRVICKDCAAG